MRVSTHVPTLSPSDSHIADARRASPGTLGRVGQSADWICREGRWFSCVRRIAACMFDTEQECRPAYWRRYATMDEAIDATFHRTAEFAAGLG